MRDLAAAIYEVVVPIVGTRRGRGTIRYGQVCERLRGRWAGLNPHGTILFGALGVMSSRCKEVGLPALSALVVTAKDGMPGTGYYSIAHPELDDAMERVAAWGREFDAVHKAKYPPTFEDLGR